jgi:uncharacterized protein YegL
LLGISLALVAGGGCGRAATVKVAGGGPGAAPAAHTLDLSGLPAGTADKAEPDTVGIFFCLDVSGSMDQPVGGRKKIDISKGAMRQVFAQIAAYVKENPKKKVKVGICSFSNQTTVVHPLKPFDQGRLEKAIAPLRASGGTAIGDAMTAALRELLQGGVEKRAIIVMTDGENNAGAPPEGVARAIKENHNTAKATTAGTELFLVAFDVNARAFDGVKQAGAAVKAAHDQKSLQAMFQTVVEEILLESPN